MSVGTLEHRFDLAYVEDLEPLRPLPDALQRSPVNDRSKIEKCPGQRSDWNAVDDGAVADVEPRNVHPDPCARAVTC